MPDQPLDINKSQPQLKLPTEERFSWSQLRSKLKYLIQRQEQEIELMPFWRGVGTPLAIVTAIAVFVMAFVVQLVGFGSLGPTIPLYYNSSRNSWADGNEKSVILFMAIGYAIVFTIVMRLIFEIYKYDHRLSQTLSWVAAILNILILFALGQIFLLARG